MARRSAKTAKKRRSWPPVHETRIVSLPKDFELWVETPPGLAEALAAESEKPRTYASSRARAVAAAIEPDYEALVQATNAQARGFAFERLVEILFYFYGFDVESSPRGSPGRQVDLMAASRVGRYLIEVKWQRDAIGDTDMEGLVSRLDRAAPGAVGCFVSMSPFTAGARKRVLDVRRNESKGHEIVLLDPDDIASLVRGESDLLELLADRLERLRTHADVAPQPVARARALPAIRLPVADAELLEPVPPGRSKSHDLVFVDIDRDYSMGLSYALDFHLGRADLDRLRNILVAVHASLALRRGGGFTVTQLTPGLSWHGYGVEPFLTCLASREERYAAARIRKPHHSEEFALVYPFEHGCLALSGRQLVAPRSASRGGCYGLHLQLLLPYLPLDTSPLATLGARLGHAGTGLVARDEPMTTTCVLRQAARAIPLQYYGRGPDDRRMLGRAVVANPFYGRPGLVVDHDRKPHPRARALAEIAFLDGQVGDLLAMTERVHQFHVRAFDLIRFAGVTAIHVPLAHGDEDRYHLGASPRGARRARRRASESWRRGQGLQRDARPRLGLASFHLRTARVSMDSRADDRTTQRHHHWYRRGTNTRTAAPPR